MNFETYGLHSKNGNLCVSVKFCDLTLCSFLPTGKCKWLGGGARSGASDDARDHCLPNFLARIPFGFEK